MVAMGNFPNIPLFQSDVARVFIGILSFLLLFCFVMRASSHRKHYRIVTPNSNVVSRSLTSLRSVLWRSLQPSVFPRGGRYRLHQRSLQGYAFSGGSQADAERGVSQRFILKEIKRSAWLKRRGACPERAEWVSVEIQGIGGHRPPLQFNGSAITFPLSSDQVNDLAITMGSDAAVTQPIT
jgi:hypothetical protein